MLFGGIRPHGGKAAAVFLRLPLRLGWLVFC
jgi:hypothetical protein